MKLYGGIDLHSNNCVVVVLDEEDRVVYEKRLPNDLGYLLKDKTHGMVALKAVAHKLARACYYILRDQVPFQVEPAFG